MTVNLGVGLVVALVLLIALAVVASIVGRLGIAREQGWKAPAAPAPAASGPSEEEAK